MRLRRAVKMVELFRRGWLCPLPPPLSLDFFPLAPIFVVSIMWPHLSILHRPVTACTSHFRSFDGRKPSVDKSVAKLKEIDDIMLATGLYKRIAILPGGTTNMTPEIERDGLDVFYRRIQ